MVEKIKHNSELVINQMNQFSGIDFGYNAESVAWLDGFIERQRARPDTTPEMVQELAGVLGSYLGECIIRCYGGHWENEGGQWRVSFDDNNAVYPFSKVKKQFENGTGDSIKGFFELIPIIYAPDSNRRQTERKPWWKLW
jgi:hypothetical protein